MLAEMRKQFAGGVGGTGRRTRLTARFLDDYRRLVQKCYSGDAVPLSSRRGRTNASRIDDRFRAGGQTIHRPCFLSRRRIAPRRPVAGGLRYLGEANRIDPGCPFVTWQMGVVLAAVNGDAGLTQRCSARPRFTRPAVVECRRPNERGWKHSPKAALTSAAWRRNTPSFVRYSAAIWHDHSGGTIRPGPDVLSSGRSFKKRPTCSTNCCRNRPPRRRCCAALACRWPGCNATTKRTSTPRRLEQEQPKDPFTAAYLALCGAMGRPTQPEDKPKNVAWAVRLLSKFTQTGNANGPAFSPRSTPRPGTAAAVARRGPNAALRRAGVDGRRRCAGGRGLSPVGRRPSRRAEADLRLALCSRRTFHDFRGEHDLDLFALASEMRDGKRVFCSTKVEYRRRGRCLFETQRGRAPGPLPGSPRRRLSRERRRVPVGPLAVRGSGGAKRRGLGMYGGVVATGAGESDGPRPAGLFALSSWRFGPRGRAVGRLAPPNPVDPWPVIRQAILEQQHGNALARAEAIDEAIGLTQGRQPRRRFSALDWQLRE